LGSSLRKALLMETQARTVSVEGMNLMAKGLKKAEVRRERRRRTCAEVLERARRQTQRVVSGMMNSQTQMAKRRERSRSSQDMSLLVTPSMNSGRGSLVGAFAA
jgi:hypothetical protein